jgi:LCP family protein required for cell wall assembly
VLIGLNVLVAVCLLGAGSVYGYVSYRFGEIKKVAVHSLAPEASSRPGDTSPIPAMNILIVGSDTRAALSSGDASSFGGSKVGGARSDTIMIAHLDPSAGTASLLSIPRDLWIPIPGHGTNRINSAFDSGPDLLVRTIQDDLGIPVNHYVDVDFDTFRQVVNALGGVKFWYPEPVRDNDNGVNDSGLNITTSGCYTLNGNMALSLVRTRHLQYQDNGRWVFEAESDLARIRRQQLFVKTVIQKAESSGVTDITKLNGVVGGLVGNLTVDTGFSRTDMLTLARRYQHFNPDTMSTATLPTTAGQVGAADVLFLEKSAAQSVIAAWEGGGAPTTAPTPTPATAAPSDLPVGMLNGSGTTGQARAATEALVAAGFTASISGNGRADSYSHPTSIVRYNPADLAGAQRLQSALIGGAQLDPDSTRPAGSLSLITGATYGGVLPSTGATAGATPGTAAGAATTTMVPPTTVVPAAVSAQPAFPGPHGKDPAPAGSGC